MIFFGNFLINFKINIFFQVEVLFQQTRQKQALTTLNEAINGGKVTGAAKRKRGLEFDTMRSDNIGPGLSKRLKAIKTDRFTN